VCEQFVQGRYNDMTASVHRLYSDSKRHYTRYRLVHSRSCSMFRCTVNITSAHVMFSRVSVCLSVNRIVQKLLIKSIRNFWQ